MTTEEHTSELTRDRGAIILVLGILGLVLCFPFGIASWVMGNTDLQAMDRGTMDPGGRGMTQAGKILGIVSVCLTIVAVLVGIVWIGFVGLFAMGAAGH